MRYVIETCHLAKHYQGFPAVRDVSLRISKGEIYGFIGLNGAGKTTTIRILVGMIRPTKGACYLNGKKVGRHNQAIWHRVGYMIETPHAYPELTVQENLEMMRKLRFVTHPHAVTQAMDWLRLTRFADKKAKHLSLGNAQRLGIAKALLHQPDILILDEPVNGLDPAGIVEIRDLLQDLAYNEGVTSLISSHLLDEVTRIATKIGIIHEGTLIQEVDPVRLNQWLKPRLLMDSQDNQRAAAKLSQAGYTIRFNQQGFVEIYSEEAICHPDKIARFLVYEGLPPTRLSVEKEDLEAYFLSMIERKGEI